MISEYVVDGIILNNFPYTRYRDSALVSDNRKKLTVILQRILPMIVHSHRGSQPPYGDQIK